MRTDGGEAGGEKRQRADRLWIVHMHDFTGPPRNIVTISEKESVQYEANINHISKNNIPAAPASLCSSPFSFCVTAASPGVCSIKHSPLRGAGMYQGKVKNKKEGCLLQTMRDVQRFL